MDGTLQNCLFKKQHSILPENFKLSTARLDNQLKHLKQQPHILKEYNKIITDQLESRIIKELNPLTDCPDPGKVYYLSDYLVIRKQAETTKIRVVTPSLNQCLNIWPSLIPMISDILLRFRWNRIAVTADIKSAFLMINIAEHNKHFLRLLWVDDINSDIPSLVFYCFCRARVDRYVHFSGPIFVYKIINSLKIATRICQFSQYLGTKLDMLFEIAK